MEIERAAVIGAGVIGASWTTLFLAHGLEVAVFDSAPDTEARVRDYVARSWPTLEKLGLTAAGNPEAVRFHDTPGAAVEGAGWVQESVPERLAIKREIYPALEAALPPEAVVATSSSGLLLSELQQAWGDPARLILAHPFNPPHLIPLVELYGNERTAEGLLEAAEGFYEGLGKTTIRLEKEVPGHVANRLQAALWREAIHLVVEGVATLEDVDKAVWAGPGLRWAVMGPSMLFNLAAGPGGMQTFCERMKPAFDDWWADLGAPELSDEVVEKLVAGIAEASHGQDVATLAAGRDVKLVALLQALAAVEKG